jgi:hypothetical protein
MELRIPEIKLACDTALLMLLIEHQQRALHFDSLVPVCFFIFIFIFFIFIYIYIYIYKFYKYKDITTITKIF